MNELRKAAEMALKYFEDAHGLEDTEIAIKEALRQALAHEALDRMVAENQKMGLYDEDNLQTAIEKGTKAWSDVPNATEWVEELRGDDTPEVTPEVNEPEGWVKIDEVRHFLDSVGCGTIYKTAGEGRVPLYLAPPKRDNSSWVGLTEEELRDALHTCPHDTVENLRVRWLYAKEFARAIEDAHGIGEQK